ncbi:MAG: C-terminal binding protein [Thermovirgaceae bacterium]
MSKFKVLMTDTIFPDMSIEEEELSKIGAELRLSDSDDPEALLSEGKESDALLVNFAHVGADVINRLEKCKIISNAAIGVNNIDVDAATRKGIMVANVPDYCTEEVADHTVALFLSGIRKIVHLSERVKEGFWEIEDAKPIPRLRGKIYGLFGCGAIGRTVARRVSAFGMEVVGYDPYAPDEVLDEAKIRRIDNFEDFFSMVDAVSLHVPLTEDTCHIIDRKILEKMKPSAFMVNASRGALINEKDLYEALKGGTIAGAAMDVLENEPPKEVPPLAKLPNVTVTPHVAFYSEESAIDLRQKAAREIVRALTEGTPLNWVNRKQMAK